MSDMFHPVPDSGEPHEVVSGDPFESEIIGDRDFVTRDITKSVAFSKSEEGQGVIEVDHPYLGLVDVLPDVAEAMPGELSPWEKEKEKRITLQEINHDVKEFTDDIDADRQLKEENGKYHINTFVYNVQLVRIFGQYVANVEEMAAYFCVNVEAIRRLMNDQSSDFYKVYHRAGSLTTLSLRQVQIKAAMGGSERMMIHVGKHILNQRDDVAIAPREKDYAKDGIKRRARITTLTQRIEEFDVP